MNRWQWTAYVLLLVVMLLLFDGAFRVLLKGDVTVERLDGEHNPDTLIVYLPGLVADGEWSGRQLTDTWRDYGDVWLVNPTGDRFKYEVLAEKLTEDLEADTHQRVVFIGSSLGAHNALDILGQLSARKLASTRFDLIAVCSPSRGVADIKQPLKAVSPLAWAFRLGPVTNLTWGRLYTRAITGKQPRSFAMTYYVDQANYQRSRPAPDQDLLRPLNVIYVQALHDEIVSSSAASAWDADELISVDSKHVAYDADPEKWNEAFVAAFDMLAER